MRAASARFGVSIGLHVGHAYLEWVSEGAGAAEIHELHHIGTESNPDVNQIQHSEFGATGP
jgi:hypothetical protein